MSDLLKLTSLCNRQAAPVISQPQLIYLLTELTPGTGIANTRIPLNFALVLDHSGSMAGEKLRNLKKAVKRIIDQLQPEDIISVVMFDTVTEVLIPAQLATNPAELKKKVDFIRDGATTNMSGAIQEGLAQVMKNFGPDHTSRIILLTDGDATDSEDDSRQFADQAGTKGVPIITLGFGDDWKEDFLFELADRSILAQPGSQSGYTDYIPSPDRADRIFQEVYQSMNVVAQKVTVTTRLAQGIEARKVWQVFPMIKEIGGSAIQGRAVVIPVGQLEKGGTAFLVELMLPPRPAGLVRIAQTVVDFAISGQGDLQERADMLVNFSADPVAVKGLNGHVMNVVEKVQAYKLQTQALNDAGAGNINGASQKLRAAVTILLSQGENDLADQMTKEADQLAASGKISNEGKKTIQLTSRKTVRLSDDQNS